MASTTSTTTLSSTYTSLINYQIQLESKPLTRLEDQKTQLETQRAVYADLKIKLEALRASAKALLSTDPFYNLKEGKSVSITPGDADKTVASASVSSSAVAGSYSLSNIILAKNHKVRSDVQEYTDQALSKAGTFYIGGTATRSASTNVTGVASFGTDAVEDGQTALTTDTYYVEMRKSGETWQFRLVDSTGNAVSIKNGEGYSSDWQAVSAGTTYSTGRGMTIDFGSDTSKYVASTKGSGAAAVKYDAENTTATMQKAVDSFSTGSTIETGQQELGSGNYYVETRQNTTGEWQFRLVDSEGNAVKTKIGEDTYSANWQSIPTGGGTYDTGRGLTINFGSDSSQYVAATKATGATSVSYAAKGAEITVTSEMSLVDIADAINNATYGAGNEVTATIINKQLIISADNTGSSHSIVASGSVLEDLGILSGSTYKNEMQTASDASFTVEGMSVTRSKNTGLTDVIAGVTLNLASDAEGQTATINIKADSTASRTAINSFISGFNALQTYLSSKLSVTKNADDTYTRGALSGDTSLSSLRYSLLSMFTKYDATGGLYKSMTELGITAIDSTTIGVTNEGKLTEALASHYSEVTDLFDRVMSNINTSLSKYSGTKAYVDQMITSNEDQSENVSDQIDTWNTRLEQRKAYLTKQYVEVQAQMTLLSYQQQTNSSWISSLSIYS